MARLSEHGIRMSSMSPSFLNSNSTSHTWPFSAVAELIDNASDPGVCAKQMWIDVVEESGQLCLTFTDNGCGMTPNKLHKMLSFGFTEKGSSKLHQAIGVYGNGFKSGSMRLGRDALIFTKNGGCQSVGMLSQTYLENIKAQTVVVPIVPLNQQTKSLVVTEDSEASLAAILKHSIVTSVEQICKHFDSMTSKKGTKILIWNLRRAKDGKPEFDFETDVTDILLPSLQIEELKKGLRNNATIRFEQNVPEMHYSLKAYLSILYLKPRTQIILRGKKTTANLMSKSLISVEHDVYSPHFSKDKLKVTFGLNSTKKDQYGIMLYHKNRLIKAYEKVGCQLKASGQRAGVGVIGIIECNFLKPAHNKQDFEYTKEYRLTLSALGVKLNDYWKDLTEKQARARAFQGVHRDENEEEHGNDDVPMWLQCEECLKWRSIPAGHYSDVPESWNCSQNPNRRYRSCSAPEEAEDSVELLGPSYHKSHKKKKPRKNRGQESSLEDFEKDQLAEHETSSHSSQKNQPPHTSDHMRSSHRCNTEATTDEQKNTFQFEGFEEVHVEDAHTPDDMQTPESCHAERNIQEHAPKNKNHMEDFTCTDPHTHNGAHKKQTFTVRDANSKDEIQEELVEHERNDPVLESEEKPRKKGPNMETMERMSANTNILSFKRKSENLFSRVKKRPCVWMNQKPDAESMDEEINPEKQTDKTENPSSEQTKQDRPSQADNAGNAPQRFLTSLSRAYSIPSTQTMIVPPLTRTEMALPPDETDQAVNLQKLTGLEKEVQRLRQILGLQITKKTQGTMTTADFSAEKSKEGLLTQPGSSREVGCQTEVTASSTSSSSPPQILNELHQRALVVQNTEEKPEQSGPRKKTESQSWVKSSAREVCEDSGSSQESLRSIRNNVVVLLTTLLPQLDLTDISLETTDVDNVLQQIIEVNSLNL